MPLPSNYQESYREKWQIKNSELTFDTWPGIPTYLEIESPNEDELNQIIHSLGLDLEKAFKGKIDEVYEVTLGVRQGDLNKIPVLSFANWQQELAPYLSADKAS